MAEHGLLVPRMVRLHTVVQTHFSQSHNVGGRYSVLQLLKPSVVHLVAVSGMYLHTGVHWGVTSLPPFQLGLGWKFVLIWETERVDNGIHVTKCSVQMAVSED